MFNERRAGLVAALCLVATAAGAAGVDGSVISTSDRWGVPRQLARQFAMSADDGVAELVDAGTGLTLSALGTANGGVEVAATGQGLEFRKSVDRNGRYSLTIRAGDDVLHVRGESTGVVLKRGDQAVTVSATSRDRAAFERAASMLAGSPALALFRSAVARLSTVGRESAAGTAMEITDVLLRVIQDDPAAVERFRDGVLGRQSAMTRISFMRRPCYGEWEHEVLAAWEAYESCYHDFSWWSGGREGCALLYTLRAEAAWLEFLACLSIRIV